MILDEEVFAVILAVSIVSSTIGIAITLRPEIPEPFNVIGLLNENCKIGNYPRSVVVNTSIRLCIFVSNYMGKPVYYKVVYKIGDNTTLPSDTSPSPAPLIREWYIVLDNKANVTMPVDITVYAEPPLPRNVTLIFELWSYDTVSSSWVYTGRWVHYHVTVIISPLPR